MVRSGAGVLLLPHAVGAFGESAELFNSGFEDFCDLGDDGAGPGRRRAYAANASKSRQLTHVLSDPFVPAPQGLKVVFKLRHGG